MGRNRKKTVNEIDKPESPEDLAMLLSVIPDGLEIPRILLDLV